MHIRPQRYLCFFYVSSLICSQALGCAPAPGPTAPTPQPQESRISGNTGSHNHNGDSSDALSGGGTPLLQIVTCSEIDPPEIIFSESGFDPVTQSVYVGHTIYFAKIGAIDHQVVIQQPNSDQPLLQIPLTTDAHAACVRFNRQMHLYFYCGAHTAETGGRINVSKL